ncbi:MAG: DNA-binding domain-containing protein [Caulobacteraceae bacterium]
MPSLAETQAAMARALLADPAGLPDALFASGPVSIAAALRVHRNTVFGALANALRLTYATVDRLVGEEFFDQAACAYAAFDPPRQARLDAYGDSFPAFLAAYGPAQALDYLGDVASLDLAIDRAASAEDLPLGRLSPIDAAVALAIPVSLTVLELQYPADLIRAALDDEDEAALGLIDLTPSCRWVAVWRSGEGAMVRALSPPAGAFLAVLAAGLGADQALAAAGPSDDALLAIQAEVFAAPFATITQISPEGIQP